MSEEIYGFDRFKRLFLERQCYSSETIEGYGKDLESFRRFVVGGVLDEDFQLERIEKEELLAFMDDGRARGNKANTVGRRLATLKSFYKFLVYELDYPVDVAGEDSSSKSVCPADAGTDRRRSEAFVGVFVTVVPVLSFAV